jgi:hypothetical protein
LPHHLQTSGVGWLVALVVLLTLSIVVFADRLRGPAVTVTVLDDAVVRWLAGLDTPGLIATWRTLAFLGSWWVLNLLGFGLLLALLALRRFRHLIIVLIVAQLLTMVIYDWVGPLAQRPRPFGIEIARVAGECTETLRMPAGSAQGSALGSCDPLPGAQEAHQEAQEEASHDRRGRLTSPAAFHHH